MNNVKNAKRVPFCTVFELSRGLNITKEDYIEEGIPCLSYGDIHSRYNGFLDATAQPLPKVSPDFLKDNASALLKPGDVVFADTSEDYAGSGDCTCILNAPEHLFAGYHTTVARVIDEKQVDIRYLGYYFQSQDFRSQIQRAVNGIKVYSITNKILNTTKLLLPDLEEQKKIADFLDQKASNIDMALKEALELQETLQTYRSTLISSVIKKEEAF